MTHLSRQIGVVCVTGLSCDQFTMGNIQTTPGWLGYCRSHGYNRPILGQGLISFQYSTKENEKKWERAV